jgi:triosephosphate isomerase (TIM)
MTKKLIIGNWKMNGNQELVAAMAQALAGQPALGPDIVVCPPFPYVAAMAQALTGTIIKTGAQLVSPHVNGAFTGDVAAPMLADCGATHVIVGHSERRAGHHETSQDVAKQAEAAQLSGLTAVICVGETLIERDSGRAFDVVRDQLSASIPAGARVHNTVVAYEPVWAIGTGKVASEDDIAAMHAFIRSQIQERLAQPLAQAEDLRIVYGGSVKPDNAATIMALPHVGGVLVGGASLKADSFLAIIKAC